MLKIKSFSQNLSGSFFKKLKSNRGDGHFLAVAVLIILVVLVGTFIIPRIMNTSKDTLDKTDNAINNMWNYNA